ncbi:MAG: hypothetical protein ACJ746_03140 [Bryobacteraceae bacterium]
MVIAIRKINKETKERAEKSKDENVAAAGASLRDKLSTIEEEIYQVRNRANEDPLNFPNQAEQSNSRARSRNRDRRLSADSSGIRSL